MTDQTHCSVCQRHLRGGGVWCGTCGYVHIKCGGLQSKKDYRDGFICTRCSIPLEPTEITETSKAQSIRNTDPQSFWSQVSLEKAQLLASYYDEVVHWKPRFFSLRKNKVGHNFVKTLSVIITAFVDKTEFSFIALKAAMVMPHLVLTRPKDETDGSLSKTLTRRMDQWLNAEFGELFQEAKALQQRQKKTLGKHNRDVFEEFDP